MFCVPAGRKSYQFEVTVGLEELSSVPFVNGVLFAKLRLLDTRNSKQYSSREAIKDHVVTWNSVHKFHCRLIANVQTNMLEPSELKISIRKEIKGGKSYLKMGYVLVNISCFANLGSEPCRRRYILEGYNQDKRQDNSMVQMHFTVCQLFGDPLFRVPAEDTSKCVPYEVLPSSKLLIETPNSSLEVIDILEAEQLDSDDKLASIVGSDDVSNQPMFYSQVTSNSHYDTVAYIYNEISRQNLLRTQEDPSLGIVHSPWDMTSGELLMATIPKFTKQTPLTQNPGYSTCPPPVSHLKPYNISCSQSSKFQPAQVEFFPKSDDGQKGHRRYTSSTQGSGSTAVRTSSSGYCSHSRHSSNESTSCSTSRSPQACLNSSLDTCEEQVTHPS